MYPESRQVLPRIACTLPKEKGESLNIILLDNIDQTDCALITFTALLKHLSTVIFLEVIAVVVQFSAYPFVI